MLEAVVLDEVGQDILISPVKELLQDDGQIEEIFYKTDFSDKGASLSQGAIVVTDEYAGVKLEFDPVSDGELFCTLHGLQYEGSSKYDLYFGEDSLYDPRHLFNMTNFELLEYRDKRKVLKSRWIYEEPTEPNVVAVLPNGREPEMLYQTEGSFQYNDRHDFTLNLGYINEETDNINLLFKKVGRYSFDSLSLYFQPLDHYEESVSKRRETVIEDLKIENDKLTGKIAPKQDKFLLVSIPFSIGWKAFLDGEEVKVHPANDMFLGISVPAGEHYIEFRYETPFLKAGAIISLLAWLMLGGYLLFRRKEPKRKF